MPDPKQYLFEVDRALKRRGLPPMPDDALREAYKAMQHPQFGQAWASGQINAEMIAEEVSKGLSVMGRAPQDNGRSVLPAANQGLPAAPKSRLYGDVPSLSADILQPTLRGPVPFGEQEQAPFASNPVLRERLRQRRVQGPL